jgi:uncharacterized OB-fold protein
MEPKLLKSSLYAPEGTEALPDRPSLLGGCCPCGHVFFPMHTLGCEVCGRHGDALRPMRLTGRGRLLSATIVHLHADPPRPAPFTIGKIALDDGPVVRTLLETAEERAPPGTTMVAALSSIGVADDGSAILDLRFTPLL